MKIKIITVSKKCPKWVDEAYNDYEKRFNKELTINAVNISTQFRSKNINIEKIKESEAKNITNEVKDGPIIVLDENGKNWSTKKLAKNIDIWQQQHGNINIIIGGPDGLSNEIISKADFVWSLSNLTLPHFMVKVILIEQLYRAWSILNNHPYHRD